MDELGRGGGGIDRFMSVGKCEGVEKGGGLNTCVRSRYKQIQSEHSLKFSFLGQSCSYLAF